MQSVTQATLVEKVLQRAVALQQIAAPTFSEHKRASFVQEQFLAEGLADVSMDAVGNVYARLPGAGRAPALVVSAHLDTVFPAETDLTIRRSPGQIFGPGIGDNSLGVAGLFGLLWGLREQGVRLPGDLWLAANVGEEGLGDLSGMRAVVERFQRQVLAYLILEGMALGQVYHRALAVQRYQVTVRTGGGHSWVDFGSPSAIHELALLITRLAALPLPKNPRTTINVGIISGGTSINTIAAEAHCELDLRSESSRTLMGLVGRVMEVVAAAGRDGVEVAIRQIGARPSGRIAANHPLVSLAMSCIEAQGLRPNLTIGSTDANIPLSLGLPAVCIGLTTGGGAHTQHEHLNTDPLRQGLAQLVGLVKGVFQMEGAWGE